ncbi:MAG: PQQ-dependent sugar dehydrogenase [Marinobacter sp.]|uniref:PQQ-dependent sugar dehydrogenase n=1 Tax=Marinobacter sp. TaxID=50741 RepID=UPI0034A0798E
MTSRPGGLKIVGAFIAALVFGALLGSVIQTQFNLMALQNLGVEIAVGERLQTSLMDIVNFAPVYGALFGVSFLLSQSAALLLGRVVGERWLAPVCALAAAIGLWVTFILANALAPMPTLIAATRGSGGLLAMLAGAAVSGWLFARLVGVSSVGSRGYGTALGLVLVGGLMLPADQAVAQPSSDYRIEVVTEGLEHPWSIAFLPGGGALVTERVGRLRLLSKDGKLQPEPLSGVPEVFASGQSGLNEVSLAPDFPDSQQIYLSYACGTAKANHTCLARSRLGDQGLENTEEIFRVQPAKVGAAHYGGRIAWLPDDTLALSLGDGFDYREEAQKLTSHIGTIVRLNGDGSAPADNPFKGQQDALPEIYSYGHRNVQGLIYDSEENRLIAHEHGPKGGDEINLIEAGKNYGWPITSFGLDYTGARVTPFTDRPGMESPLLQWTPSIAPSGMTLYTGELFPQWQGDLLVGALAAKQVHRVSLENGEAREVEVLFEALNERIRDVETGPDGAVYLLTDSANGQVLRVTPR